MTPSESNPVSLPRAVVINDDLTQLALLSGLLHKAGLAPLAFSSVESALDALGQDVLPVLFVTDVYMPGIDGWRFCRLLRSRAYERFNKTPIMVVSATFSGIEPLQITSDLGANAFMSMPVDGANFIAQIQALLKGEKPQPVLRVLIVDDSKFVSTRLQQVFQAHGYLTQTAFTAEEGLNLIARNVYDLAVLDYHLPDGLGDDLLRALQSKAPDCVCMMMTTDPQPELALTWMKMGAAAYLHKPFEPEYLLELCDRARRERALLRSQDLLELRTRQLQESEIRFRNAMDATNDGLWDWDIPSREVYYSPAYFGMLGYAPNELPATLDTWLNLIHPEDRDSALAANQACLQNETEIVDVEFRMMARDGSWRWIHGRGRALSRDADGQALQMIGTHVDITERKQAEQALRESEANYRLIIENQQDLLVKTDPQGRLLYVNSVYCDYFDKTEKELLGRSFAPLVHPEDMPVVEKALALLFNPPYECAYESRANTRHGWRWLSWSAKAILDERGAVVALTGSSRDITERKQAEQALRESEEKFRWLVENSHDIIYTLGVDGVFTFVSPAWTTLLGHPVNQVVGHSFQQFVHTDDLADCMRWLQKVIETGKRQEGIEYRVEHIDGTWYWHTSSAVPVRDAAGAVIGFEGTARDITEHKKAEAKINEQLDELRRWQNVTLGREDRILELKREVNQLAAEAGRPPRYASGAEKA